MPWDVIERRIAAATTKPASVSLHCIVRKGQPISMPMCQVTLRFAVAAQLDWKRNEPIGVVIGTGEHAGLIRIIRNSPNRVGRCRVLTRGGLSVNLGHIPQFGLEPREKRGTDAKVIDADTVEVILPDWSLPDSEVEAEVDEDEQTEEPVVAPPPKVVVNGVTVVFEDENEHVIFGGQAMEVTTRQAKFVSVIARTKPEPCGRSEIIKRMWGSQPPNHVDAVIDQIARDLVGALSPIGLTVKPYKGVGFALRETKAQMAAA